MITASKQSVVVLRRTAARASAGAGRRGFSSDDGKVPSVSSGPISVAENVTASPLSGNANAKSLAYAEFHGRSSVSGVVATVFGGSGFLGRYVVNRLGRIGSRVVVPHRRCGLEVRHLKLMGDLGQIRPVKYDIRDMDLLRKSVRGSNVVINLIGQTFETKNFSYDDTHVNATKAIAVAAREEGVDNFIQVSMLGADENSHSGLYASKGHGEKAAREYYPDAVILRPATMFGDEDNFIHRVALHIRASHFRWPVFFYNLDRKLQPVAVEDVADAVLQAVKFYPNCAGNTYELVGPDVMIQRDLLNEIYDILGRSRNYVEASRGTMEKILKVFQITPFTPRAQTDEVNQWDTDCIKPEESENRSFSDLNLIPRSLVGQRLQDLLLEHTKLSGEAMPPRDLPIGPPVGQTVGQTDMIPR